MAVTILNDISYAPVYTIGNALLPFERNRSVIGYITISGPSIYHGDGKIAMACVCFSLFCSDALQRCVCRSMQSVAHCQRNGTIGQNVEVIKMIGRKC